MLPTFIAVVLSFLAIASSSPLEERNTCNRDNVLRCLVSASAIATPYCSSTLSLGVVTSYTGTTTPISTATDTITVTVTSPAAKVKRGSGPQTTIYAGSPITVVGPGTTSAVLNRRTVEARATTSPAPGCLAQYSPAPSRVTSACNCLSITSSTLSIVSIAPATTANLTVTATATVAPPPPPPSCPQCNLCSSNANCQPGFECDAYVGFAFGDANLCTTVNIQSSSDICSSICS